MPKVVTSSLKWTWWCPSSSTILGVALIKSNLFLETFSCWNLFPEFLSDTPHITEFGKCQNVIWSDWILIWWSCIWKLRSTLKNYLCSQFAFLFSTKAVIPSFRSFVPKDACKIAAWANLTLFYAIQELCCFLLPQLMAQFNSDLWQTKKVRILREHEFAGFTWNILFSNLRPSFRVSSAAAFVDSLAIATAIWDNQQFCWNLRMGWFFQEPVKAQRYGRQSWPPPQQVVQQGRPWPPAHKRPPLKQLWDDLNNEHNYYSIWHRGSMLQHCSHVGPE